MPRLPPHLQSFLLLWIASSLSFAQNTKQVLPNPDKSYEAQSYAISSVVRIQNQLLQLPVGAQFFIQSPLEDVTKKRPGPLTALTKRVPMKDLSTNHLRFLASLDDQVLLLDGVTLQTSLYSAELDLISSHSLPYDRLSPPRDRGGEAPAWEVKSLRKKFLRNYATTPAEKLSGLAPLPKGWLNSKSQRYYLVASRISGFPLLLMACQTQNPSQCQLERACFAGEGFKPEAQTISGLAFYAPKRLLLIGDSKAQQITALRFHSCFHSELLATYALPATLKKLGGMAFDAEGTLWLSTLKPDDYQNATVFSWRFASLPISER